MEVEHRIKTVKDFKALRYLRLKGAEARFTGLGNLVSAALNLEPSSG